MSRKKNTPEQAEAMRQERNTAQRKWNKMLKAAHICRDCKQTDAYTLTGRTYCAECAGKRALWQRQYRATPKGKDVNEAHVEEWRDRKRREGLCEYCGKHKTVNGKRVCDICLKRKAEKARAKRIANGMNWPRGGNGYCWLCNKVKAIEGKRLCPTCYEKRLNSLNRRNEDDQKTEHVYHGH